MSTARRPASLKGNRRVQFGVPPRPAVRCARGQIKGIRSLVVACLGLALAGGSAYAAQEYVDQPTSVPAVHPGAEDSLATLVVATPDIPCGAKIGPGMLRLRFGPRDALPIGAFTGFDTLSHRDGDPRRATCAVARGQPVLSSMVSGFGETVTLVQALGPNRRVMAIKVDAETAVGGFVPRGIMSISC